MTIQTSGVMASGHTPIVSADLEPVLTVSPMTSLLDGFVWVYKGQKYRPVGFRTHTTKAGRDLPMIVWESDCRDCGASFVASTPYEFERATRRCSHCVSARKAARSAAP